MRGRSEGVGMHDLEKSVRVPQQGGRVVQERKGPLSKVFPHHQIMIFSDKDKEMMLCMPC